MQKNNTLFKDQDIQDGSAHLVKDSKNFNRINYMIENFRDNKAYKYLSINHEDPNRLKSLMIEKYKKYRNDWLNIPQKLFNDFDSNIKIQNPMCVDIEVASICDLACPHCFRDYIMTPDKIIKDKLFYKIIDSISNLGVPSIKLNWRGEPLLHPKIYDFIDYAKKKGILEVIINTNATKLNNKNSEKLINSGLDQVIFSFDGGTEKTYNKMRPGRFGENTFQQVYSNIINFNKIRKKLRSKFPTTKVQMVLTEDTRNELDQFFNLFNDNVDDVTVIQYNERGGVISEFSEDNLIKIKKFLQKNKLPSETPIMITADGKLFYSNERKPCNQLFQRLMVTFDGKIGMCCHDWGAQHCIGYVDNRAFKENEVIDDLEKSILKNKKGFELLKNAKKPKKFNSPEKKVQDIYEIWNGNELNKIRLLHKKKELNKIDICKDCNFKDTYKWSEIL